MQFKAAAPPTREFLPLDAKSDGRFGKQDFVYLADGDVYRCPAAEKLTYRMTTVQDRKMMRRYWTNACQSCPLISKCTTGTERRIPRWEHEHVLEAAQQRLDENPQAMRQRRKCSARACATTLGCTLGTNRSAGRIRP